MMPMIHLPASLNAMADPFPCGSSTRWRIHPSTGRTKLARIAWALLVSGGRYWPGLRLQRQRKKRSCNGKMRLRS